MTPAPPKPPSDDDPNIDKIKRDDEKPVEKFKADDEKPFEKFKADDEKPVEKFKADDEKPIEKFKADDEKPFEKLKPEKEHKLEVKEIEKFKADKEQPEKVKADKEQPEKIKREKEKQDGKEFKAEAKIEVREKQVPEKLDKEIAEVGDPIEQVVDPAVALDPATLLAHADSLMDSGRRLRHFIERSQRPDLSEGALRNEEDLQPPPEPDDA
jgi:hypothetical protein